MKRILRIGVVCLVLAGAIAALASLDFYDPVVFIGTEAGVDFYDIDWNPAEPWTPSNLTTIAWYDTSDESTITADNLEGQLGILSLGANGGTNPATALPWAVGDTYRLVFVSSTSNQATSTDIADYNATIQSLAAASSLNLTNGGVTWKCIGSTATVDARDNTSTAPSDGFGEAFFIMNGTYAFATNYAHLWTGPHGIVNDDIYLDEEGNTGKTDPDGGGTFWQNWGPTWTGTLGDGTGHATYTLGNDTLILFGLMYSDNNDQWVNRNNGAGSTNTLTLNLYGMSEPLEIVAGSGPVSQLDDKSGNNYHMVQGTGADQPTTGSTNLNGLNMLACDGTDWMYHDSFLVPTSGNFAVFMVAKPSVISDENDALCSMNVGENWQFTAEAANMFSGRVQTVSSGTLLLTNGPYAGPSTYNVNFDFTGAGVFDAYVDGYQRTTTNAYVTKIDTNQTFKLFANRNDVMHPEGAFAETIVVEDVTEATRQKIEGYLAWKWGLVTQLPNGHPYRWDGSEFGYGTMWQPSEVALSAWWDTSDESTITEAAGSVSQIDDKSTNANHAVQGAGANQPTTDTRTIGGLNVFDYDGTAEHLDFGSTIDMVDKSIWAIVNVDSFAADFTVIGGNNKQNTILTTGLVRNWGSGTQWNPVDTKADQTLTTNVTYMIGFISDSSEKQFSVDGTMTTNAGVWIGTTFLFTAIADNQYAHATDGMIGEVVIADGNLSEANRQKMEGYLAWKWGQEANLPSGHPYENNPPYK